MNEPIQYLTSFIESGEQAISSLEKFSDFFPGIVYIYDLDREEVSFINNKVADCLGFTREEVGLLQNDLNSLVYEEDVRLFQDALTQFKALKEGQSFSFTARYIHKEGGCRNLKTTGTMIRSIPGTPACIICFAQNVTDQVKIEEEAAATRQLFDETEKLLSFGTWSWSPGTNKLAWTEGMYELLGYKPEEVNEVNNDFFTRHVLPEHIEGLQKEVSNALSLNKGFEFEYVVRTKTGQEKFVYTRAKSLLDKEGSVKRVVGITRDITIKKNFEKERDRNIRELNRSNKELEEFAYVASHDMHEPLRKILTFTERLKGRFAGALGDDGQLYLNRISASAANMRNLIDNLLEFSKISRGARSFAPCHLSDVINEVLADQELRIEETSTKVIVKDLPKVEGVQSELRQLFNNLISNALKFRKKDVSPVIIIQGTKLSHKEKSDHLLPFNQVFYQISVQDNGIGFESMYAEKIFEIFQRLHGKAEYSGSGIGLAICKKIVENHDGLIYASSQPGVGSTFSVILPEKQFN